MAEYTFTGSTSDSLLSCPAHNEVAFTAGFTVDLEATELFGLYVHMAIFSKILHQHANNVNKILYF
jgi:hypothetical protein